LYILFINKAKFFALSKLPFLTFWLKNASSALKLWDFCLKSAEFRRICAFSGSRG